MVIEQSQKVSLHRWKQRLPIYPLSVRPQAVQAVRHHVQDCVKADVIRDAAAVEVVAPVVALVVEVAVLMVVLGLAKVIVQGAVRIVEIHAEAVVREDVMVAVVHVLEVVVAVVKVVVTHAQGQVVHHHAGQLAKAPVPIAGLIKEREEH